MRASDHLEAAREHTEAAQRSWPDQRAGADGSIGTSPGVAGPPWYYYWDPATDHERLAEIHRSQAAQIEADYQRACGDAPLAEISVSPLVHHAIGASEIPTGMVVYLTPEAGTPEQLLAEMRCHRAWMMLGRTNMDSCPLDLAGIEVVAHRTEGAVEVMITTRDRGLVKELQRRVAMDVEAAAAHNRRPAP
ncbi:MAG: hypothetical protein K8W52_33375 [Deltaproteobacteria bacterium]|nr:hypothetical protein [Deltaproteobacteria bacterium]